MKKTLFWVYVAFVVFIVVFKLYDSPVERVEYLKELRSEGCDNVNVYPLRTLKICADNIESAWSIKNLVGNSLPFLMLGILSRNTWRKYSTSEVYLYVSAVIILLEILQYIFLLGTCDIDDFILNLAFLKIGFCLLK